MTTMSTHPAVAVRRPRRRLVERLGLRPRPWTGRGRSWPLRTLLVQSAGAATAGRPVPRTEAARMTRIDVELLRTRPRVF